MIALEVHVEMTFVNLWKDWVMICQLDKLPQNYKIDC